MEKNKKINWMGICALLLLLHMTHNVGMLWESENQSDNYAVLWQRYHRASLNNDLPFQQMKYIWFISFLVFFCFVFTYTYIIYISEILHQLVHFHKHKNPSKRLYVFVAPKQEYSNSFFKKRSCHGHEHVHKKGAGGGELRYLTAL